MQAKFIGIRRVKKERSVGEDPKKCADDRSYGQREYCALNLVNGDLDVKSTVIYSCILGSLCRDVFLALLIFDQEDLFILLDLCYVCSVVVGRSCSIGWGRWLGFYSNSIVIR